MKNLILIALFAVLSATIFNACSNSTPKSSVTESSVAEKTIYTCTMHPEIRSDKPGKCPKCGMELVVMETSDSTQMQNQSDTTHMN